MKRLPYSLLFVATVGLLAYALYPDPHAGNLPSAAWPSAADGVATGSLAKDHGSLPGPTLEPARRQAKDGPANEPAAEDRATIEPATEVPVPDPQGEPRPKAGRTFSGLDPGGRVMPHLHRIPLEQGLTIESELAFTMEDLRLAACGQPTRAVAFTFEVYRPPCEERQRRRVQRLNTILLVNAAGRDPIEQAIDFRPAVAGVEGRHSYLAYWQPRDALTWGQVLSMLDVEVTLVSLSFSE